MTQSVARRSLITRLRTDGGPSHELLVQLDRHRVLTSGQLARLTGAPQRTVTYRLDALLKAKLVACARPGRESGSSPRYWWLTAAGARLVAGVAPAEGRTPSAMFAGHASLIAEAYLALAEHGPPAGIEVTGWWPDRQAWLTWRPPGGQDVTLSPDAIATATLTAGEVTGPAAAFLEIDLATMTQTRLRGKLARYLAYAEERVWAGRWPHCPPLLLLTTTEARAATFLAAAAADVGRHRRRQGASYRYRGTGPARDDLIEADRLVIAACGLVRTPTAAVTDLVWRTAGPAAQAGPVTLGQLLAGRVRAAQVADAWRAQLAADAAAARRDATLRTIAGDPELAELLGDPVSAAAYTVLVLDALGDTLLADAHPDLAALVLAWWQQRGRPGDTDRCGVVRARLRAAHERLLREQIRRLLAAPATAAGLPRAAAAAAALQSGRLLRDYRLVGLDEPVDRDRRELQEALLAEHARRREHAVDAQLAALGRWARRRADPAALAAAVDEQSLLVCDVCAIAIPGRQHDHDDDRWCGDGWADVAGDECRQCGTGRLRPYAQRGQIPTLADRLTQLRARLT